MMALCQPVAARAAGSSSALRKAMNERGGFGSHFPCRRAWFRQSRPSSQVKRADARREADRIIRVAACPSLSSALIHGLI